MTIKFVITMWNDLKCRFYNNCLTWSTLRSTSLPSTDDGGATKEIIVLFLEILTMVEAFKFPGNISIKDISPTGMPLQLRFKSRLMYLQPHLIYLTQTHSHCGLYIWLKLITLRGLYLWLVSTQKGGFCAVDGWGKLLLNDLLFSR